MTPHPSGQLTKTATGRDLTLARTFDAAIDEIWAAVTESEQTAQWFASWTGTPGAGNTISYVMTFEESSTPHDMFIEACDPPHHLAVNAVDEYGSWHLELDLSTTDAGTELRLTHHLDDGVNVGEVGPGWEYYLDNLVAVVTDAPVPDFDDYFPAQQAFYQELAPS